MSDLISRIEAESVLHNNLHALIDTDQLYQLYKDIDRLPTYSIPSTDIMECARAIKEYCKERTKKPLWCNDCSLYEVFCKNSQPPNMWDLPEGEKE